MDPRETKIYEQNPWMWGNAFCEHYFRSESPEFHISILQSLLTERFLAIAAPRESAKSTILTFLTPLHAICYKRKHFIVILTNTFGKSVGALRGIKDEFKNNMGVKAEYGVEITKDSEGDSIFRHPDGFETRILCKGAEQMGSIRGERFGAWRPDLLIVDDLEDDELVRNPDRRRQIREEFDEAVLPAVDFKDGQIIAIGTILHDDSLMKKLVSEGQYEKFDKLFFQALNETKEDGEFSLWEEKWNVPELKDMQKNTPSKFAKEYQNDPVSGAMQRFYKKDFRYWYIENNQYVLLDPATKIVGRGDLSACKAAIACDLAWETKREADFTVIVPGFLTPNQDILVETYICKKGMRPHEIEEVIFNNEARLRTLTGSSVPIGFEKAKLEKVIQHLLKKEMKKRGQYLIFKPLMWDADKLTRIETRLEPRYAQHTIYHRQGMGELELQLVRFPAGTHDDLPDAVQGLVQLLQYPKTQRRQPAPEDEFMWYRERAIEQRHPKFPRYKFNKKKNKSPIPARIAYR